MNAIPKEWKRQLNKNQPRFDTVNNVVTEAGQISSLTNKQIRNIIAKQSNQDICAVNFWRHNLNIEVEDYFLTAYEATNESRLRLLHFKFLHNIYPTDILLEKMGVKDTNKCLEAWSAKKLTS